MLHAKTDHTAKYHHLLSVHFCTHLNPTQDGAAAGEQSSSSSSTTSSDHAAPLPSGSNVLKTPWLTVNHPAVPVDVKGVMQHPVYTREFMESIKPHHVPPKEVSRDLRHLGSWEGHRKGEPACVLHGVAVTHLAAVLLQLIGKHLQILPAD